MKFVRLVRSGDVVTVDRSGVITYEAPPQTGSAADAPDFQLQLAPAFERFRAELAPGDERIVVGLPGPQTLGRFFGLPSMSATKLKVAVAFEIGNQIPLPPDEVVSASLIWRPLAGGDPPAEHRILVVAAKKSQAALRASALDQRAARSCSLQSDCVALLNVLLHCHADQIAQLQANESIALIEVGDTATNIVAVSPAKGPWFRTVHRGVRSFNRPLVEAFGVTWQQAQQLRHKWPGNQPMAAVDRALASSISGITAEVRRAIAAYERAVSSQIVRIYLAGGGADQFGLLREWSQVAAARDVTDEQNSML